MYVECRISTRLSLATSRNEWRARADKEAPETVIYDYMNPEIRSSLNVHHGLGAKRRRILRW